jgi:hypothetical protein
MICEHYWRDGIMLVERGEPDPHRDACVVCSREHKAREALIRALPLVGGTTAGDPNWEARVWRRIARLEPPRARRWWFLGGGVATACAIVLIWWTLGRPGHPEKTRPRIEVVPGEVAMRSTSLRVGDRVRIAVKPTDEVRIYRADHLVLRCPAKSTRGGCASDTRGMVAEALLAAAGDYQLVVITAATAEPVGGFDRDLWAIVSAGGEYQITELSVR